MQDVGKTHKYDTSKVHVTMYASFFPPAFELQVKHGVDPRSLPLDFLPLSLPPTEQYSTFKTVRT